MSHAVTGEHSVSDAPVHRFRDARRMRRFAENVLFALVVLWVAASGVRHARHATRARCAAESFRR